ncbi:hypothetical protein RyT2_20260 [Pseudolactococcus yaeyamensis]
MEMNDMISDTTVPLSFKVEVNGSRTIKGTIDASEGYVDIVDQNGVIYNLIKGYIYPKGRTYHKPDASRPDKPYGYYTEKSKEIVFLLESISEVSPVSESFPDTDIPKELANLRVITAGETLILDMDSVNKITFLGKVYEKKIPVESAKYIFGSVDFGAEYVDNGLGTTLKCVKLKGLRPNW